MNTTECIVIKKETIKKTLAAKPAPGKRVLEPLKSLATSLGLPFNILEDTEIANEAEMHKQAGDLWHCLEGTVTFIYGGKLVDPKPRINPDGSLNQNEFSADAIKNGAKVILQPGDWLWIPPGQPHQHACTGTARLVIIKIPSV